MSRAELFDATRASPHRATPHDFVVAYQRDLMRLAFALTGDRAVATFLTRDVFLDMLSSPDHREELDPNSWSRIVCALGRRYMLGADPETTADEPANPEAARLREAVELLSRPMRTALVLRDLGGLNARDVAVVTGSEPDELDDILDWCRERLNEAAGHLSGEPPQRLLASLAVDAPRRDLWPAIAPVVEERERSRRRRSRRIVAVSLSAFLVFATASTIWFLGDVPFVGGAVGATATPTAEESSAISPSPIPIQPPRPTATAAPTPAPVAWIGATLGSNALIQGYLIEGNLYSTQERAWLSFTPDGNESVQTIPSNAHELREISPDGRWVAFVEWKNDGTLRSDDGTAVGPQGPVISVTYDGVKQDWEYVIPYGSFPNSWDTAILGDRLYIINSTPEPATLTAVDLETGAVVLTRALEVPRLGAELRAGWIPIPEGDWDVAVGLYAAPAADNPDLIAFVTLNQYGHDVRDRWTRWLYRIDPDDLRSSFMNTNAIIATSVSDDVTADFPIWEATFLPDNSGLYTVGRDGQQSTVRLLDFVTGRVETVSTSFSTIASFDPDYDYHPTVVSNDGRRLYIYSNLTGEVAIVDLVARRVERTFLLDLHGVPDAPLLVERVHLAHDGQKLYLIEARRDVQQVSPRQAVWVVDLSSWSVVRQLDVLGHIRWLSGHPDGERLWVVSSLDDQATRLSDGRFVLWTFDTETYEELDRRELPEFLDRPASYSFISLIERYRQIYGHTPTVDGLEPSDVDEYSTLPQARIVVEDENIPVGVTRSVELVFLDPATSTPLSGFDPRLRYDPNQPVTLVFEQPGAKSVVTVPVEFAAGQQQGTFKLKPDGVGSWNARIIVGDAGDGFTLLLRDVFRGTPTFEADDGRFYTLRLETEPAAPLATQAALFRAVFVDAMTGNPLPEGVLLTGGMPETVRVALASSGALNRDLDASAHGVYEALITLEDPGAWETRLIFRQPEAEESLLHQIEMGVIEVIAA